MQVRDGMSSDVLAIGPNHSLRQASQQMSARGVGAAVVQDPDSEGIGILTERDVLRAVASGVDLDTARVQDHVTSNLVFAAPSWTLEQAAEAMTRGGFRHLIVLEQAEVAGILSVRDIVGCWSKARSAEDELVG
jgi:CBS domain-containing protein